MLHTKTALVFSDKELMARLYSLYEQHLPFTYLAQQAGVDAKTVKKLIEMYENTENE